MKGYIKIKKANLEPDKYGQHIKITMIGLYDEDDKWLKWIPLNDKTINFLIDYKIDVLINPDAL
jgi:UDP-3-O-acyl-N-acetylglucosamine deacetylase